jgi:tetratricopeptide (TPR) repeat protein
MRIKLFLLFSLALMAVLAIPLSGSETNPVEDDGQDVEALIERAGSLSTAGDFESALGLYVQACEAHPRHSMAFRGAGFVLLEMGRPEEAIPYLEEAARIDPSASRPVENLGLAHAAVYDNVTGELRYLAPQNPSGPVDPDHPVTKRINELNAKLAEKDWRSEALAYLREAVRMEPQESKYWYNLGTTLKRYRRRGPQESIEALLKAVELDQTYYPALRNLALSLRREGRLREAREVCLRMEETALPGDPAVPSILGDIAFDDGDLQAAERYMLRVLELDPRSTHAHITLAYVYRERGEIERSLEYLEKTVDLDPENETYIRRSFEADSR